MYSLFLSKYVYMVCRMRIWLTFSEASVCLLDKPNLFDFKILSNKQEFYDLHRSRFDFRFSDKEFTSTQNC